MTTGEVDPGELRPGDVLLLEAGPDPRAVSTAVTELDGGHYSHALLVHGPPPHLYTLSANPDLDPLDSGVNAVALGVFNGHPTKPREIRVLRPHAGGEAAAAVGASFVEQVVPPHPDYRPNGDRSDFGWEHIVISAVAAFARHLEPGCAARRILWRLAHGLSMALVEHQTDQSGGSPAPGGSHRWDCCHFVDHCFRAAGSPLDIRESDPPVRRPVSVLVGSLAAVIDQAGDWLGDEDPPRPPPLGLDDRLDHDLADALGDGRFAAYRLAGRAADRLGLSLGDAVRRSVAAAPAGGPGTGGPERDGRPDLVWPPFISPRMLLASDRFVDLGIIPRGTIPPPR